MGRVLVGALVVSVVGNALLLYRAIARRQEEKPGVSEGTSPTRRLGETQALPSPPAGLAPSRSASKEDAGPCEPKLADVRGRLDKADKELLEVLPPWEKYDRLPASETPARLRRAIDRFFAAYQTLEYDLECHGDVCLLDVTSSPKTKPEKWWGEEFQQDRGLRDLIKNKAFGSFAPSTDPIRKEGVEHELVHFVYKGEGHLNGVELLHELMGRFRQSPAVRDCSERYPADGFVDLTIRLLAKPRAIEVDASGDLAEDAVAACIVDRVRAQAASLPIPDGLDDASVGYTVEVDP